MKVLVMLDLIPTDSFTAIVDMTQEEYDFFSQAHNYCVNVDEYDKDKVSVVSVIENAFCHNENNYKYCPTDKDREYFGKWNSDESLSDIYQCEKMIRCSFYL